MVLIFSLATAYLADEFVASLKSDDLDSALDDIVKKTNVKITKDDIGILLNGKWADLLRAYFELEHYFKSFSAQKDVQKTQGNTLENIKKRLPVVKLKEMSKRIAQETISASSTDKQSSKAVSQLLNKITSSNKETTDRINTPAKSDGTEALDFFNRMDFEDDGLDGDDETDLSDSDYEYTMQELYDTDDEQVEIKMTKKQKSPTKKKAKQEPSVPNKDHDYIEQYSEAEKKEWKALESKIAAEVTEKMGTPKIVNGRICCNLCRFTCQDKKKLYSHIKRRHVAHQYKCELCSSTFGYGSDLGKHKRLVHGEATYTCEKCAKSFTGPLRLKDHMQIHINMPERVRYPCSKCDKFFLTSQGRMKHVRQYHLGIKKLDLEYNECKLCEKVFTNRNSYLKHVRTHNGKFFNCDVCAMSFKTISQLNDHKLKHTDEINFECHICHKKFKHQASLSVHKRIHDTKSISFTCRVCGKSFHRRDHYKRHEATCSKDKIKPSKAITNIADVHVETVNNPNVQDIAIEEVVSHIEDGSSVIMQTDETEHIIMQIQGEEEQVVTQTEDGQQVSYVYVALSNGNVLPVDN